MNIQHKKTTTLVMKNNLKEEIILIMKNINEE